MVDVQELGGFPTAAAIDASGDGAPVGTDRHSGATEVQRALIERLGELTSGLTLDLARLEGGVGLLNGAVSVPAAMAYAASVAGGVRQPCAEGATEDGIATFALQAKLRELEARHHTREAEAAELVERTKRLASIEADKARRELAAVLESKNAEVDAFRCELDAIVLDIKLMHARQSEAAALAAKKPRPSRCYS
jgi:hypothetical protein